jgi:hypothetical protein
VPDVVHELLFYEAGRKKLGRRAISEPEARQLCWNPHEILMDPHAPRGTYRRLMLGETDGGRTLTLVIERTREPTEWIAVTGWETGRS